MRGRLVTGLLCMSVVAVLVMLPGIASAGVCTKPPCAGVKWYSGSCICCTTGSEVFNITATGVPGWFVKGCPANQNCLKCSVYGTADVGLGCDPTGLDSRCGVEGVLFCVNHGGNSDTAEGQPFTFDSVLTGAGGFENCTKAGKCTSKITVIGPQVLPDVCINRNWEPAGFTASKFNGECCSCDAGFDKVGDCCADGTRTSEGLCFSKAEATCTVEGFRCSVNAVPKLGNVQPYQCCLLSELVFSVEHPEGVCPS